MSAVPRIECVGVGRRLGSGSRAVTVLEDVTFTIQPGEFVAVCGPSGSGKSTLLGLMAGLDRPDKGEIRIDGWTLRDRSEDELALLRRDKIGFVFQSFQLLPNLTASENVLLPLELLQVEDASGRTERLLNEVGLGDRLTHYPSQLSGGEQQRVALARAFGSRPSVLLADEPTGSLDHETGLAVLDLLLRLREAHEMTLVLVTHDPAVASRAHRLLHLQAGRVVSDELGSTGERHP